MSHVTIREAPRARGVDRLRAALADARAAPRPFIASAARHSMGGQSLATDGSVVTLDQQWLEADTARTAYRVAAGTRWSTVIATLDAIGFSPAVMQSNNDFGVASTFAVNAHGWPVPFSGCGSTVRAMTMLLADGTSVTCSRSENADLFRLAMGGYGLCGVITELELDMVPNTLLSPTYEALWAGLAAATSSRAARKRRATTHLRAFSRRSRGAEASSARLPATTTSWSRSTVPPGASLPVQPGTVIMRMTRDGFTGERLLVDVKVAALAALLTAYPAADPGLHPDTRRPLAGDVQVEHVFDN